MHISVIKSVQNGKVYHSKLLRSSFRDDNGRVQKKTLANLSHLPDQAIDLLKAQSRPCSRPAVAWASPASLPPSPLGSATSSAP